MTPMTIDKDGLASLLERVREAKGPDRNLDAMIHHWALDGAGTGAYSNSPAYTASIDAALALTERMFPGSCVYPDITPGNHCCGLRYGPSHKDTSFSAGATPALAILGALLTALSTKEG